MKKFYKLLVENMGLYEKFKSDFTYHSSAIEGSKVNKKDNAKLVNNPTPQVINSELERYKKDEVIENKNLGDVFDNMFANYDKNFSVNELKLWHNMLKINTDWSILYPNAVGKFRIVNIDVGDSVNFAIDFKNIPVELKKFIDDINYIQNPTIDDIALFHCRFEQIHPFQDGNGRIGRMIILKHCLKSILIPFFVNSSTKNEYINCLRMYRKTGNYDFLTQYFNKQQRIFLSDYSLYLTDFDDKQIQIMKFIKMNGKIMRMDVERLLHLKSSASSLVLKRLVDKNILIKENGGRSSFYILKK